MNKVGKRYYEFGPFRLDESARLLFRGEEIVPVTPRVFELLRVLVQRRGEIVDRDELMRVVWRDRHVVEANLHTTVFALRKILDAGTEEQSYIANIPRRGYRFAAEVREVRESTNVSATPESCAAAYELYLEGHCSWNTRTEADLRKSVELYNLAVQINPDFALAYAALASTYALLGCVHSSIPPRQVMPRARAAALKAMELDDQLVEAHTAMGMVHALYDWDWPTAEDAYRRALELNPQHATARHWYGLLLAWMGRTEEAFIELERARQLDPFSPIINANIGWAYYAARRYGDAINVCRKTITMAPNFYRAYVYLGWAYERTGDFSSAIGALRQGISLNGGGALGTALGYVYARSGRLDEARRLIAEFEQRSTQSYVSPYAIALVYAGLEEVGQALDWLERAYEERTHWLVTVQVEPKLDGLRANSRFTALVNRIGLINNPGLEPEIPPDLK